MYRQPTAANHLTTAVYMPLQHLCLPGSYRRGDVCASVRASGANDPLPLHRHGDRCYI